MVQLSLERAIERFKTGDSSAFDYIYDNSVKVIFFVAYGVLKNRAAADDVVQETYLSAFKNLKSYHSEGNPIAWLTTIAKRLAINEYNRRKREVFTDFAEEAYRFGESDMPDPDSLGLIPLAESILQPDDFQIVVMCAVAGFKRREVANLLKMPISTVTFRYSQALKLLRNKIEGGAK